MSTIILQPFFNVKTFQHRQAFLFMKWSALVMISAICLVSSSNVHAQTIDNSTDNNTSNNATSSNNFDLATKYLDQANDLFKDGKYQEAITYYDKVLAIDPTEAEASYGEARSYEKLGQYSDAITYYDKALATDPRDTAPLYGKALALEKLGKPDQAIPYFDKILEIEPENSDVMYQKGLALQSLGKKDEAISYFNKALHINPQNTEALNSRNLAMGLSLPNQKPYPIDTQMLIAIGVIIAGIAALIVVDKKRSRRKIPVTKPIDKEKNNDQKKIDESVHSEKKQEKYPDWKGI